MPTSMNPLKFRISRIEGTGMNRKMSPNPLILDETVVT
jgi:hypothetical protein